MDVRVLQNELIKDLLSEVGTLVDDESVSEIMINGYDEIYAERGGVISKEPLSFKDKQELEAVARSVLQFVGKRLPSQSASLEARLPDGSRVHIVKLVNPPDADRDICISIRKFRKDKLRMEELVGFDSLPQEIADLLVDQVRVRKNIIVSGGTGSGKTTMLNCLSEGIGDTERIILIEDASELQLKKEHVLRFEVRPPDRHGEGGLSVQDLFRGSLRMRPDRVIVGECRGGEAFDMIQAMNSGHSGSLSTVHADTPEGALLRIETLCMMGDTAMPLRAIRRQIAEALDTIVQVSRYPDGKRATMCVAKVLGLSDDPEPIFLLDEIYKRN